MAPPAVPPTTPAIHRRNMIGIDLGGTKTAVGLVSPSGEVTLLDSWPTQAADGADSLVDRLSTLVCEMAGDARRASLDVAGVGLATPGIVDSTSGTVRYATPALPGWTGLALGPRLAASTGLAVVVHNDGHAVARGELALGAAATLSDAVVVTLGTGVGGGVVAGGRLVYGHHGGAGRIGHLSIDASGRPCWCGARGCLEQYASGSAIARDAQAAVDGGVHSGLRSVARPLAAADVVAAARAGDALATSLLAAAGQCLGVALVSLVNVLSPQVLVIAGGLVEAGGLLLEPAEAVLRERLPVALRDGVEVRVSTLGPRAAVAGAGLLAWEELLR